MSTHWVALGPPMVSCTIEGFSGILCGFSGVLGGFGTVGGGFGGVETR